MKVTPLGSHDGELCSRDRAFLLEDPTGLRILYDPGFIVDETDPRLGDVHVMLLSHGHGDHIGDRRPGSRLERFVRLVRDFSDVVVPLSGVTRAFDGEGRCFGCR